MLNKKIYTLIFDLDNTLIDRNEALRLTILSWLEERNYAVDRKQAALEAILQYDDWGYTGRLDFAGWLQRSYGEGADLQLTPAQFLATIQAGIVSRIVPDPAVQDLLTALQAKYQLVLATNGSSQVQRAKVKQANLDPFFMPGALFISGEVGYEKPDQRYYTHIIERLSIEPAEALFIGDSPLNDVQAPGESGMQTCWLSYGRNLSGDIKPSMIIDSVNALYQWIPAQI